MLEKDNLNEDSHTLAIESSNVVSTSGIEADNTFKIETLEKVLEDSSVESSYKTYKSSADTQVVGSSETFIQPSEDVTSSLENVAEGSLLMQESQKQEQVESFDVDSSQSDNRIENPVLVASEGLDEPSPYEENTI